MRRKNPLDNTWKWLIGAAAAVGAFAWYEKANGPAAAPSWSGVPASPQIVTISSNSGGSDQFYLSPASSTFTPAVGNTYTLHSSTGAQTLTVTLTSIVGNLFTGNVASSTDTAIPTGQVIAQAPISALWSS